MKIKTGSRLFLKWFSDFTANDAICFIADEYEEGHELTPIFWDADIGILKFDDGRDTVTAEFLDDEGEIKFLRR